MRVRLPLPALTSMKTHLTQFESTCDELCAVGDNSVRPLNRVAYQSAVRLIAHAPNEVRGNDAFAGVVRHHIFFRTHSEAEGS